MAVFMHHTKLKSAMQHVRDLHHALDLIVFYNSGDDSPPGRCAWQMVLEAIAAGKMAVDTTWEPETKTLLHYAALSCSAAVVKRLLDLGASPSLLDGSGHLPMRYAANCLTDDALDKCRMLPVTDLGHENSTGGNTPLHIVATFPRCELSQHFREVLQWMLDQPECDIDAADVRGVTAADLLAARAHRDPRPLAMLRAARAERARWTPQRAAWTGAVAVGVAGLAAAGAAGASGLKK